MEGKPRLQKVEAADRGTWTVKRRRGVSAGVQLTVSFLSIPGGQCRECCCSHLG